MDNRFNFVGKAIGFMVTVIIAVLLLNYITKPIKEKADEKAVEELEEMNDNTEQWMDDLNIQDFLGGDFNDILPEW